VSDQQALKDTFGARANLELGGTSYRIARLDALEKQGFNISRLPYATRLLLENLLRRENNSDVSAADIEGLARWDAQAKPSQEIAYMPARVILQDFTGVPAIVDLAAMRDAIARMGGDPNKINPQQPVDLVIDHSVQVDKFGTPEAFAQNVQIEFQRNNERYTFLKWGATAFENLRVVPPGTGIVHQVNVEYLASVVANRHVNGVLEAFPDTLVGTDSHTTMVNGLGVLAWGVGGIEAEAAMLGQPISMLVPQVVGFKLHGQLREGMTATDLVLTVVEMLRKKGVVGKFVEFFGPGLASLSLADRATVANMAPEYGATTGIFPVDAETLRYLAFTGRSTETVKLVEAYMKEQGMFHSAESPEAEYSSTLELDLDAIETSLAGPKRPQDRVLLRNMKPEFEQELPGLKDEAMSATPKLKLDDAPHLTKTEEGIKTTVGEDEFVLKDGSLVIAAITSCTNTSNPSVLIGAGLVAKKAVEKGLTRKPWVKTSLAPGSQVVTDYLKKAGLMTYLEQLQFHLVGYGCTTCIGNSGPLAQPISDAIDAGQLVVTSVLSGNRNFEGRVSPQTRANYLASPPLVVAYALAGRVDIDLATEALGTDKDGQAVYLKDIWPSNQEIQEVMAVAVKSEMYSERYANVFAGDENWQGFDVPEGSTYAWDENSTYIKEPPYFVGMGPEPSDVTNIIDARVLALMGDSVTTDHISPAGQIAADTPAAKYLRDNGVATINFNSYGSRRGNHEVMMRGTFANIRVKNKLVPGVEGGYTIHLPTGEQMSIFDAAMKYNEAKISTIVIGGKEYGTGSSRDWAAKGPNLQGVRAVIVESYERIHRSNLVGMGILPLEFVNGESAESLGLTGHEVMSIAGLADGINAGFNADFKLLVQADNKQFTVKVRLDTPQEIEYYKHGGILQYVLRQLNQAQ
jgi:aconitate hydratase